MGNPKVTRNRDAINQNALQQAMRMRAGIYANVTPLAVSPNTTAGQMLYDTAVKRYEPNGMIFRRLQDNAGQQGPGTGVTSRLLQAPSAF